MRSPNFLFLLWIDPQVTIISPIPASPKNVSNFAPDFRPSLATSFMPRVINADFVLSPYPNPSQKPAAIAITFLAEPQISTPIRSSLV